MVLLPELIQQLRTKHATEPIRIVAFGSSNTSLGSHNQGRHSWVCLLGWAIRASVGLRTWMINTGIGGDTAAGLCQRVDGDVVAVKPHMVIITIGGNDCGQQRPLADFERELRSLATTLQKAGAAVVFQTYYAHLPEAGDGLIPYMDVVRKVAAATGAGLIDQYAWFLPWQKGDPATYRTVMMDAGHLNALGNTVFGITAARVFGVPDPELPPDYAPLVYERLAQVEKFGAPGPRHLTKLYG